MKKRLLTATACSALALTSIVGMGTSAFAADSDSSSGTRTPPTAEQIANREAIRKAKMEERLTKLVEKGTITAEQKTLILEFFEENKPPKPDPDATKEERKAARDAFKEKVKEFAEENDIPEDVLKPKRGHGKPGGENRSGSTSENSRSGSSSQRG